MDWNRIQHTSHIILLWWIKLSCDPIFLKVNRVNHMIRGGIESLNNFIRQEYTQLYTVRIWITSFLLLLNALERECNFYCKNTELSPNIVTIVWQICYCDNIYYYVF